MKEEEVMFQAPPRLLMGVAFLFWGAMQDQALAGLIAAVVFEARNWTGLRWSFGEKGFARAWQLCILFLIVSVVGVFQIEDRSPGDFLQLLAWLPFVLMPIGLAQQYSSDRGVPMTTFSFIARRKLALDRKMGRPVEIRPFQLGYPFLALIIISTGMAVAVYNLKFYAVGVVLLMGVALYRMSGTNRRPKAWGVAFLMSAAMAVGMVYGIKAVYDYVMARTSGSRMSDSSELSLETRTQIGQVTNLQQSKAIVWRYFEGSGPQPKRLRMAAYNMPERNNWRAQFSSLDYVERIAEDREAGGDFEKLLKVGDREFFFKEEDLEQEDFGASGRIEGLVSSQNLIPIPLGAKRLTEVKADSLASNSMGTTQIIQPDSGAAGIEMEWDPETTVVADHDPSEVDLDVPSNETKGVRKFLRELGIESKGGRENLPSAEEIEEIRFRLQMKFATEFRYSTFTDYSYFKDPISHFLNEQRAGHCEYFASASAMLMRAAGVPARYAVGYVVEERGKNQGEWILRGKHAHAWCQVYVGGEWVLEKVGERTARWRCRGGSWVDVDLTPSGWLDEEPSGLLQKIYDRFQGVRTGLILWFAKPIVSGALGWGLSLLGILLLLYLIVKLFTTRRTNSGGFDSWDARVKAGNLLANFERWLSKRVGERPESMTMSAWLRRHLPAGEESLIGKYESVVFGSGGLDENEVVSLHDQVARVKKIVTSKQKTPDA